MWRRWIVQVLLADVAHDPDDRTCPLTVERDLLPDRVFAREVGARRRFVDHDTRWRANPVERLATPLRNGKRAKVVWRDRGDPRRR